MKRSAIAEREGDGYVSLYPELDNVRQGNSIEQARDSLREAFDLIFDAASKKEIKHRLHTDIFVTQIEVAVG
ncbi:MAG: type II toxin-antitoxin system HicB family antitoxin [Candidatus Brocadia sp.]|nr:hypothetical protein [Candidatus Brocadia sp.]MDG6027225.1 type II toxin-antitoxin system HicB family antitoxin [Candidatus Brocadia sp.]